MVEHALHQNTFFERLHEGPLGRRLCIWTAPRQTSIHSLVFHVHAFGEEMNKSRRMAAMQAKVLATSGFGVLQLDLLGCGDSDGDFSDATWAAWIGDVKAGALLAQRLHQARGDLPESLNLWLWGHRAGALLAARCAVELGPEWNLLLWQPMLSGKTQLQQLLRMRLASERLQATTGTSIASLKSRLDSGETLEVGGYGLTRAMAHQLEADSMPLALGPRRVAWIEGQASVESGLLPASRTLIDRWVAGGTTVQARTPAGPSFWQTTEIEDAPEWLAATLAAVGTGAP